MIICLIIIGVLISYTVIFVIAFILGLYYGVDGREIGKYMAAGIRWEELQDQIEKKRVKREGADD